MHLIEKEIDLWFNEAVNTGIIRDNSLLFGKIEEIKYPKVKFFKKSVHSENSVTYYLMQLDNNLLLVIFSHTDLPGGFSGRLKRFKKLKFLFCKLDHKNAAALRKALPFTSPSPVLNEAVTFGVGDRLGIAGPGHIRLFSKIEAIPVLAQQSVREVELMGRTYEDVLDASTWAVFQEGFNKKWGADGDHLKTEEWVRKVLEIGFTMITADVSQHIKDHFASCDADELFEEYLTINPSYQDEVETDYLNKEMMFDAGCIVRFTKEELARSVAVYKDAIDHAERLFRTAVAAAGKGNFDFELSIDETTAPTTPQAHIYVASELKKRGVSVASIAPRFVGEFQKGVDYIGNIEEFQQTFKLHALIAKRLGHKLSVHSGSDKFSVFPSIGKLSGGLFHIKTSGTNWLVSLGVIADNNLHLFRKLYAFALEHFEKARSYYHVTPNIGNVPDSASVSDAELPALLRNRDARQVLHITYGEICALPELKEEVFSTLQTHIEDYWKELERHIGRHTDLLGL
jgi:hypothetical protein